MQRGRALHGIALAGPEAIAERLRGANEARLRNREQRVARERLCRMWLESTREGL